MLAGPLCTMVLGDLGANVIKVEHPAGGDDTRRWGPPWVSGPDGRESAYFLCCNRNKRSIVADLGAEGDRALVRKLALRADVLVENFAPGTLRRWDLDYPALARANPRLIFCSITGYGSEGAAAGRAGYDFTVQARAGWMAVTGEPEGEPMKVGFALVDVLTGQNAALAILAALVERDRSGQGQRVEVSLLGSALAGLVNVAQGSLAGAPARRLGNAHPNIVPYQAFHAADRPLVIAVGNDAQWRRLCTALGLDSLADDPRFASNPARVENREALISLLESRVRTESAAALQARLDAAGVPCETMRTVEEALSDPALSPDEDIWRIDSPTLGSITTVGSPLHLDRTPARATRPPPALGQHDGEVREGGWEF